MSLLATHLRPLIVSNLKEDMNPRIKRAMMEVFNAIDQDLNMHGYSLEGDTASSQTEEAVEKLEKLLQSFYETGVLPEEEFTLLPIPEKEKEDAPDENSTKYKGGDDEPT